MGRPRFRLTAMLALALAAPTFGAAPAGAQTQPAGLGANAALKYWQAFAMLPKLKPEQAAVLPAPGRGSAPGTEAAVESLRTGGRGSMACLREGAALACDWGLTRQNSSTLTPHLSKAQELGWYASVLAADEFEHAEVRAGVDDLIAVLTLARHVAGDPFPVSLEVGAIIEETAAKLAAPHLSKLDADTLGRLASHIDARPAPPLPGDAVRREGGELIEEAARQVQAARARHPGDDGGAFRDALDQMARGATVEQMAAFEEGSGRTTQGMLAMVHEAGVSLDELARIVALPLGEAEKSGAEYRAKAEASTNPIVRGVCAQRSWVAGLPRILAADSRALLMLRAAIARRLGDSEGFARVLDPFSGKPFEVADLDNGGFDLRSAGALAGVEALPMKLGFPESPAVPRPPAAAPPRFADAQLKSVTRMREVHQACIIWSNQHNSQFPPGLATLVREKLVALRSLLPPGDAEKAPADFATWPPERQARWIETHGDIVYITGREDDADSTKVVLFLKVKPGDTHAFVVWGDNHGSAGVPIEEFRERVREQTGKSLEELSAAGWGKAIRTDGPAATRAQ